MNLYGVSMLGREPRRFWIRSNSTRLEVEGTSLIFTGVLGSYFLHYRGPGDWRVTDELTGNYIVAERPTRQAAVQDAKERMLGYFKRCTPEQFHAMQRRIGDVMKLPEFTSKSAVKIPEPIRFK